MALGIRPTHLDSHMGTLFTTPELIATYVKVAHDYRLPFLAMKTTPGGTAMSLSPKDVTFDAVVIAGPDVPRDQWKAFYLNAIANLQPGLTEMIVHLGHDDAELQAVTSTTSPTALRGASATTTSSRARSSRRRCRTTRSGW
jgi:hypothetical protein